jgi:segregation and condensation protein B
MVDQPADSSALSPEDLGHSYEDVLGRQMWQVDVGTQMPQESIADERPTSPPPLARIIEALLFVGGPPLTAEQAAQSIRGLTAGQFTEAVETLNRDYRRQGRPYAIQAQGDGYVLALRPRFRPVLDKLYGTTREARLSPPAVDVLALVAYRQPATKPEIDSLRGADSGALLRQLVRRGLIAVVQRGESGQREVSYGTTPRFLEMFGLSSRDDLPQTQDLQRL